MGLFCGIFCLMCEVTRKHPSVTCGASSPFRGAYKLPIQHKARPSGALASPERGGEPAKLVEGFLWNLLLGV